VLATPLAGGGGALRILARLAKEIDIA